MLSALLGDLLPYLIAAGGAIAALVTAYITGRKSGRDRAKGKAAERRADDLQTAKETRDAVDNSSAADVRDRLHDWTRD